MHSPSTSSWMAGRGSDMEAWRVRCVGEEVGVRSSAVEAAGTASSPTESVREFSNSSGGQGALRSCTNLYGG